MNTKVFINSGRYNTNVDLKDYISQIDGLNPSEIVLTSVIMMECYQVMILKQF